MSKSSTKYTVPVKSGSGKSFRSKTWGAKTCPGNTNRWNPVTRSGRSSTARTPSRRSRGDESYISVEDEIVYVDQERKRKGCCGPLFWCLVLLATALLIFLILWFTIFQYWGEGSQTNNGGTNVVNAEGDVYQYFWHETNEQNADGHYINPKPYSDAVCWYMNQQKINKKPKFLIDAGGDWLFEIDMTNMVQRSIKWSGNGHKWFGSNYSTEGMKARPITYKIVAPSAPFYQKMAHAPTGYWQWQDEKITGNDKWRNYSPEVSDYITCQAKLGVNTCLVDAGQDRIFKIKFAGLMGQPTSGQQLSTRFTEGKHTKLRNGKYKETGKSRAIRWVENSDGKPVGTGNRLRISTRNTRAGERPRVQAPPRQNAPSMAA